MRHEPCALVGNAEHPMELVRTHSLLTRAEKMNRLEPRRKRDMGILEDRAHANGELLSAGATLPYASANGMLRFGLSLQAIRFSNHAAVRANSPFRPAQLFDKLASGIFVAEVLG